MPLLNSLSFASPLVLLALIALPALWLLLRATPPQPRRVRFPAVIILRELKNAEETPDRTPWWLLLMRLAIAALAILALSGPVLNAPKAIDASGPIVFVVDDSWAAAPHWRLRQDAIRKGAAEARAGAREVFVLKTAGDETGDLRPLTGEAATAAAASLKPQPFRADRSRFLAALQKAANAKGLFKSGADIRWLSDGVADAGDTALAEFLKSKGDLKVYADFQGSTLALAPGSASQKGPAYSITRLSAEGAWTGTLAALADDGRELARTSAEMASGSRQTSVALDLPLALRNRVASVRIDAYPSAGGVQLADARDRRALVGVVAGTEGATDELLTGAYYVRKALEPYAESLAGTLDELLASDISAIVLDDIGRLRAADVERLQKWVTAGGVVIRFSGPNLADAAQDEDPPLVPVRLRGGGRAFGGALTWETPQRIGAFSATGPFADLVPPQDLFVREQVLAAPSPETTERTWASLEDGTPIVTGERIGSGALALIHVPATPGWSDLPLSSLFVDMLRRLIFLSTLGPENLELDAKASLAPIRVLDAFGRFERAKADAPAISSADAAKGAAPGRPPGYYGAPEAPIAVNAIVAGEPFEPLEVAGAAVLPYTEEPPARLAPPLFAAALLLFILDAFASLFLSGKLRPRPAVAGLALAAALLVSFDPPNADAAPVDAPIDSKTSASALKTRLAYVRTGDPEVDRITERGLASLTLELIRRTALEPAPPIAVDPETDDLSVYPLLYWPVVAGAPTPSDEALANIENFMRFGGLIVFDTRDDERAVGGAETPERAALREILKNIDVPPLAPVGKDHVLNRSFYLLNGLSGRTRSNPVWAQASGSANDGVTAIIIGGRDWAAAWALDEFGRPLRPTRGAGDCGRSVTVQECAIRAGINIAMVAYTGNYKADQVHTPILLQRLTR